MLNNIKNNKTSGFTIVELLIVIVVIAILAAITIVAYNGIQQRSKSTAAQSAANNAVKKLEIYHTDTGNYADESSDVTGSSVSSSETYKLDGVTFDGTALSSSNLPTSTSELNFQECGHSGTTTQPANQAAITSTTGNRVGYWNYQTPAIAFTTAGQTSGSVGTFPVACFTGA